MKNGILKNFLNGASVVVISLLATINPSSAKDTGVLLQKKSLFATKSQTPSKGKLSFGKKSVLSAHVKPALGKKSGLFANVKSPLAKKAGLSAHVKPALGKKSVLSANVKSPLAKSPGISANVKPVLGKKSGLSAHVKPPLAKSSVLSANVKSPLVPRSLTSAPKRAPVAQQSSLTDLLLSDKQKAALGRTQTALHKNKSASASKSLMSTPRRTPVSQHPSLTDLLLSEQQKAALSRQAVARQQIIEQRRQQEVARQRVLQEDLRRQEAWNRLTPTERLVRTPFVKTMTPLAPAELRWALVGCESLLLGVIKGSLPFAQLPQQNERVRDLVDSLVFATSVRQALAGRNQAGEMLENFDVPARIQAYRANIAEIEEATQELVGFGANLPPQLVNARDQLVQQVPIVRAALNDPNSVNLFRGVARLRGLNVANTLRDMQNALEELNNESLGLLMTPQILTPLRATFANNARVLGSLNSLTDVHRVTQALNIQDIAAREQALRAQPMQDALQNLHIEPYNGRVIQRDFQDVFSPAVDLGYQGSGRTLQYGNIGQGLNLPKAPVFHPYNPTDSLRDGWGAPAFTLNLKLPPGYNAADFAPAALNVHLRGRDPSTIDHYVIVQDVPWDLAQAPLQYRPQSYLDPECPFSSDLPVSKNLPARIGVFSRNPGGPLIQGQGEGALLEANGTITVHNPRIQVPHVDVNDPANILLRQRAQRNEQLTAPQNTTVDNVLMNLARARQNLTAAEVQRVTARGWKPALPDLCGDEKFISSGAAHPLLNFNMNDSRVIWSLTESLGGDRRVAVTKHILLTPAHNAVFEEVLKLPNVNTYQDIQRELHRPQVQYRLNLGGGGNLANEFDIPVR